MFNNATNGYSLADIAAATGTNRNDNGNGLFGGGSTGSGITDGYILTSDFANIERKIDSVDSGLCDGFYAMR